jgi:epoxyqueuosine reductase
MEPAILSGIIYEAAIKAGIDLCRIALPRPLTEDGDVLREWCNSGMNAGMSYLSRDTHVRENPLLLFPEAKSVIVAAVNYYDEQPGLKEGIPVIARYALGKDYHTVIREKLEALLAEIRVHIPDADGKICVDSSPVLEKAWAVDAGIGWQGKHSLVITNEFGSWILIGLLLLNKEAKPDTEKFHDKCGSCSACIDSCPTGAINNNRTIDARKCISNHTIENRGDIPDEIVKVLNNRVYGCDICQEVCPHNAGSVFNRQAHFVPSPRLAEMGKHDWEKLTGSDFLKLFEGTPVERVKYQRFRKNLDLVLLNGNTYTGTNLKES